MLLYNIALGLTVLQLRVRKDVEIGKSDSRGLRKV